MHTGGESDGICTHGQAPNAGDSDVLLFGLFSNESVDDLADKSGTFGIERGEAAVDVVVTFRTRSEGEVAVEYRFRSEDF